MALVLLFVGGYLVGMGLAWVIDMKTKAQIKRMGILERRGFEYSHENNQKLPVMVARRTNMHEQSVWVEVLRNGAFRPANP